MSRRRVYELKKQFRASAPFLAKALASVWRSRPVDYLFHAQRRWRLRAALNRSRGAFAFDISGMMGLGATLSNMINLLNLCDQRGLWPYIRFGNPHYLAAGAVDWFPSFFSVRSAEGEYRQPRKYVHVGSENDYRLPQVDMEMSLERANALFHRYIAFADGLTEEADAFASAHGLDHTSIGVHFRGTDKTIEAPKVTWEEAFDALRLVAAAAPNARILLATDEPERIQAARDSELGPRLVVYECQEIFPGGRDAYTTEGDRHRKAHEALVTILLLARCGICIRTASHLSAWANILNLDQKVVMLNRPYDKFMYFPDSQIWRRRWEPEKLAAALAPRAHVGTA